ncbi:MAG: lipopolysaccharide biosynthesis protein [Saprospiraceae bacterium]|nr:lipopolysaccharide biosynthesis protein [Saprospiraceae bacterium]
METIKKQTVRAFKWNVLSQLANQVFVFGVNLVLIRLLSPYEFGCFAVPFMVFSFFRFVHDFGFTDVIIREKQLDVQTFSTIFWFTAAGAVVVAGINYLMSPLVALWTKIPLTATINAWLSLALIGTLFFSAFDARFRKALDFRKVFLTEFLANVLSAVPAIALAWQGLGWQALVARTVVYTFLLSIISFAMAHERPLWYFSRTTLKQHSAFASANIGDQLLGFLYRNMDTLLISRYIGSAQLGLYDRAYKFLTFPVQQISGSFSKVMFPAMAQVQDDQQRLVNQFLKICRLVALVAFPLMSGLALVSADFTQVVFGPAWKGLAPLLSLFALLAVFSSLAAIYNQVFYVTGQMRSLLRYSMITKPALILVIWLSTLVFRDVFLVAACLAVVSVMSFFPLVKLVASCLGIRAVQIWKDMVPLLGVTLLMLAAVALCQYGLNEVSAGLRLGLCITVGAGVYVAAVFGFRLRVVDEVKDLLRT